MGLLSETKVVDAGTANRWAGKVHALGTTSPWWETSSVVAVVEIEVAGVLRLLCHVGRSSKSGRLFANAPSARRGDEWVAAYEFIDDGLGKVVHAVAVQAAETFLATGGGHIDEGDDTPF